MPPTSAATSVAIIVSQLNPMMGALTAVITSIRAVTAAARAANVTVVIDLSTGIVYTSEGAALAAGAAKENLKNQVPEDSVLIGSFLRSSGLLGKELSDARQWLRDSGLLQE